jgi:hypothetical protein
MSTTRPASAGMRTKTLLLPDEHGEMVKDCSVATIFRDLKIACLLIDN